MYRGVSGGNLVVLGVATAAARSREAVSAAMIGKHSPTGDDIAAFAECAQA
jgi:hypothetical protein